MYTYHHPPTMEILNPHLISTQASWELSYERDKVDNSKARLTTPSSDGFSAKGPDP